MNYLTTTRPFGRSYNRYHVANDLFSDKPFDNLFFPLGMILSESSGNVIFSLFFRRVCKNFHLFIYPGISFSNLASPDKLSLLEQFCSFGRFAALSLMSINMLLYIIK